MDEDKTMVLYKAKIKIKFDHVMKKGSSFVMCLKINPGQFGSGKHWHRGEGEE